MLALVLRYTQLGCPQLSLKEEINHFGSGGIYLFCLMVAFVGRYQVVITKAGHAHFLNELHNEHPSISQMCSIFRFKITCKLVEFYSKRLVCAWLF